MTIQDILEKIFPLLILIKNILCDDNKGKWSKDRLQLGGVLSQKGPYPVEKLFLDAVWHQGCKRETYMTF